MKLNPDCIRDILFTLEDVSVYGITTHYEEWEDFQAQNPALNKYSVEEIAYHVHQCYLYGFMYHAKFYPDTAFSFVDITPNAHEFLANIRSNENWGKVKVIAEKFGVISLSALTSIAEGVTTSLINNAFGR